MMKPFLLCCAAALLFLFSGCKNHHLITDNNYREKVEKDFLQKKLLAKNREDDLFSVLGNGLSNDKKEALQFLFAYMPLSDLADYDGDFFLANVECALRSRELTPWGKDIPEEIFLHYILPPRVNNENLDSFRIVYFDELTDRIKGLNAVEAALEINHWCHEKVEYQPSDIRTSAPISTMLSARGRCGEESTFTVAAMRTAGLPARQVYTPRWAHCDDNHAWVEIWIDGKWYYMGACEPEPVLDRGWFTEPARRAMLVHTKSFGAPFEKEEWMARSPNYSFVNNLSKYAVTKRIFVKVTDSDNEPLEDAEVEYQLYNYAEFYPLSSIPTDENGISSFETGLGDLLIWARKEDKYNFEKVSVKDIDTLVLKLDRKPVGSYSVFYDLGVPEVLPPLPGIPDSLIRKNNSRIGEENRIRQLYKDSWMKPDEVATLSMKIGADTDQVNDIIRRSMGNCMTIAAFLENAPSYNKSLAMELLEQCSDKDLRDIKEDVLMDHLNNSVRYDSLRPELERELYLKYILNPRIDNEIIVSWRKYLSVIIPDKLRSDLKSDPFALAGYVSGTIAIDDANNYYQTPVTPRGVDELKVADKQSRDIYIVALYRSLGIPSRLEAGSKVPQFYFSGSWHDIIFTDSQRHNGQKAFVSFASMDKFPEPEYYIHFTLAKFNNGRYNTLEYDYNRKISDFPDTVSLEPGHYMLVTGNRLSDARILAELTFFDLEAGEKKTIDVTPRKVNSIPITLGTFDTGTTIQLPDGSQKSISGLSGKGAVISWLDPRLEPSRHIMNDLPLLKNEFDDWGGYFIFVPVTSDSNGEFMAKNYPGLPFNTIFLDDPESSLLKKCYTSLSCSTSQFPLIIVINENGNITYKSEGYRTGIGDQLLKAMRNN